MEFFRKLAENIFFKIILGFVLLSFVLFGISEFIFGNTNSWVAKVGNSTISYNAFNKALQNDRESILTSNKSEEAMKFLESEQFKSDVLGRLVNKVMIEKLHKKLGVEASKKLILQSIVKDRNFRNSDGKFDHETFKKFLAKNALNEERYINEIANEIVATMIIQTIAMSAPINDQSMLELENFKQERRVADVVTISQKNVKGGSSATDEEIEKYFNANKEKYLAPELRLVSYLQFSKKDFAKDFEVLESDIAAEYEANKESFTKPETRAFYHILFEKEELAQNFIQKLDGSTKDPKSAFATLAKELEKKDLKAISLSNISQKDLLPELAEKVFKLDLAKHSEVLSSPLGFHVFLLTDVKKSQPLPLAEVRKSLKEKVAKTKETNLLQEKITAIDDSLLTSNSLSETAKKFGLKLNSAVKIDAKGQNEKGSEIPEIKSLSEFAQNAFTAKKDQVSKIFYAKDSDGFYAIKVEEVLESREKKLSEVKAQVIKDFALEKEGKALNVLAKKVADEIKENPNQLIEIAAKYQLKLEKNREFPRNFYIDSGNGSKVPYQNNFLTELFNLKTNQATSLTSAGEKEFVVGVLREIKKANVSLAQIYSSNEAFVEDFKTEILQEYNTLLLKENQVKVNEKIFGAKEVK